MQTIQPKELQLIIAFMGYTEEKKEVPPKGYLNWLFGEVQYQIIHRNRSGEEVNIDFANDYNALMELVEKIEDSGYTVLIGNHNIKISRDHEGHPMMAPDVYINIPIERRDYKKKQALVDACWRFLYDYERLYNRKV